MAHPHFFPGWAVAHPATHVPAPMYFISKNVPPLICYNHDIHDPITIIFDRSVIKKVGNQAMLRFFHLTYLAKQETQKLRHFYLNTACCFANEHTKHIQIITWSQLN